MKQYELTSKVVLLNLTKMFHIFCPHCRLQTTKECPKGASKLDCFKHDLDTVGDVLHHVDPDLPRQDIWNCYRLRKYKGNASRP